MMDRTIAAQAAIGIKIALFIIILQTSNSSRAFCGKD
jgi:hypothetical protein